MIIILITCEGLIVFVCMYVAQKPPSPYVAELWSFSTYCLLVIQHKLSYFFFYRFLKGFKNIVKVVSL